MDIFFNELYVSFVYCIVIVIPILVIAVLKVKGEEEIKYGNTKVGVACLIAIPFAIAVMIAAMNTVTRVFGR